MNKTILHTALFTLTLPMSLFALGLGDMTVESSLDQPFLAEIDLVDVGSFPLSSIKANLADLENYQQIGIEPSPSLLLLNFNIVNNKKGKAIIKVQSVERITEPYMELVVSLTWPQGQLYKAYTVLLDPPGYKLVMTRAQGRPVQYKKIVNHNEPGVINKTVVTTIEHPSAEVSESKKAST